MCVLVPSHGHTHTHTRMCVHMLRHVGLIRKPQSAVENFLEDLSRACRRNLHSCEWGREFGGTHPQIQGLPAGAAFQAQTGLIWAGKATSVSNSSPRVWL